MCENVAGSSPEGSEKIAKKQKVKNFALKNRKNLVKQGFLAWVAFLTYEDGAPSGIRTRDPMQHSPQAKLRVTPDSYKQKEKPFKFLVHLQGFEPGTH